MAIVAETVPGVGDPAALTEKIREKSLLVSALLSEMRKVIVGQSTLVERLVLGLLADGHLLLEGVPGLAKTLAVKTLAKGLDASFSRIQFTPDLLPADLVGTLVFNPKTQEFVARRGPVFAHIVLADEINRAPAKVQSALLEAMQERQVTVDGTARPLPLPFMVIATQNPVESQGTYPLPEAQLDRFLFKLTVPDPPRDVEIGIVKNHAAGFDPTHLDLNAATNPDEILAMQQFAQSVRVDDQIVAYLVDLVRRTREDRAIELGASPRASIAMMKAAQVVAASQGRNFVTPDDVKPTAKPVMRHRVMLHPDAQLQGLTPDDRIDEMLKAVPVPRL